MSADPSQLIDPSMASGQAASAPDASGADAGPDPAADPATAAPSDDGGGGSATAAPPPPGDGVGLRPRLIPGSDATSGNMPAGPQEQTDLNQTVDKALRMIHGRTSRNAVLRTLHDPSETIAQVVGRATFNILMSISDQKKASTGEPLPENILQEAAGYVVPELMTVGCTAGIFPFEAPPDSAPTQPGQGSTEYDRQCRLAVLEATKAYGESVLKSPDGQRRSGEAQDQWASGVQADIQAGKADPQFMSAIQRLRGQNQFPPSGTGDEQQAPEDAPTAQPAGNTAAGGAPAPDPTAQQGTPS